MANVITNNLDLWTSALLTKSTAGRGSNGRQEAYGIKALRKLILELAVRGKLVPQDPNDEPASVLLERIAKEKARLINEEVIRKEKTLPELSEEDKPYPIPESWEWARLTDLYYSISPSGKTLRTSDMTDEGKYPVVDQGQSYIAGYTSDSELLIEIPGPVVIFGDHTTEIKYIDFNFVAGADGTKILRPYRMDEKYFHTYLKSYELEDRGYARHFKVLKENLMALPPLAEQHRIVATFHELMALCDQLEQQQTNSIEAHQTLVEILLGTLTRVESQQELTEAWNRIANHFDTLFITDHSIGQLKQTILQLAVMGKLTSQDASDEPARVLLERIAEERERLAREGKIKKPKKVPDIGDDEKPLELRRGWEYVRLGDLGEWGAGATPLRSRHEYYGGSIPWFKSGELIGDYISESEEHVTELALKETSLRYNKPGDVLIAMYGATIGKTSILKVAATTNQAVCACTPFTGFANVFLLTLLKAFKNRFVDMGAGGAQPNISREKIIATVIALPPTAEQHRIIAKVDELMALCEALTERLNDAQTSQIHLADAIVEQAVA